jgi:hypothetical protein
MSDPQKFDKLSILGKICHYFVIFEPLSLIILISFNRLQLRWIGTVIAVINIGNKTFFGFAFILKNCFKLQFKKGYGRRSGKNFET